LPNLVMLRGVERYRVGGCEFATPTEALQALVAE
jgi:hypothetical protein